MTTPVQTTRNAVLFREVNERINELAASWRDGEARELLCECGDADCIEAIEVTAADYEAARERPRRFLVSADHVDEASSLLEARDGYAVVECHASPD